MTSIEAERRRALETERNEIHQRIAEWSQRVDRAGASTAGDYIFPPVAGCVVAVPVFVALVMYAIHHFADGTHVDYGKNSIIGCVALFLVVAAIVYFIRRGLRSSRIAATTHARDLAVKPLEERLREIDAILLRLE
jgi:hypothetical protein